VLTTLNLFRFLHVVAVIVWVGGVAAVNLLQLLAGRGQDRSDQAAMLRLSDRYGRVVIGPAAAVTLIAGLVTAAQLGVRLNTLWVAWGIVGVVVSITLGATLIRATVARLHRLASDGAVGDGPWTSVRRRLATLYGVNLLLLLSVVWAMESKPTL
jgi:uncharacterized membrane protein